MIQVRITARAGASVPAYQTSGAAGADVFALPEAPITIAPGAVALIPTGVTMEIPDGYEAQIRPRSGLALKHGITCLNTPGTIDSDYRGEVKVILANLGQEPFTVMPGMRIAQMVFARVLRADFVEVDGLGSTERNDGGFGHSGI
ncbi:MAG TPA: dUTP diphosphatase [Spirochaetota bacterium]|mgnify:FL=1|nr:dUTP diphosphatase [Spirochaetota bacterium]HNU90242.1 dUTP diphosphatase [Spirochaetota bacterium]HPV96365.1 dUTP diphosphatase [Spirochaetota bacterium]